MSYVVYLHDGTNWVNVTNYTERITWSIDAREIENLQVEFRGDVTPTPNPLTRIKLQRGTTDVFEGIIYERELSKEPALIRKIRTTAYTDLMLYDRHAVFRTYDTGTTAGAIIKDLAALETGVDVTNVDDATTPTLNSPWEIQNEIALRIMQETARGVNYWLRMRPGKKLYFKPRQAGTPVATIDNTKVLSAEYTEDKWRQRNRIIYVGQGGQVLADVSESPGDMPLTIHDPFLTDVDEATRRANTRLQIEKEYGKSLRVVMAKSDFEALNVDLGDTVTVNLPDLGLSNVNMFLFGVETEPASYYHTYTLTLGGMYELLEHLLDEQLRGESSSLFGGGTDVAEEISTIYTALDMTNRAVRVQADARTVRYYNSPPLLLENASNVVLDDNGYAGLASGYTSGSFEVSWLPASELFSRWLRVHYDYDAGDGSVSVDLLRADNSIVVSNIPQDYEFEYLPTARGWLTEMNANEWGAVNATLSDVSNSIISFWAIKAVRTASPMKIYYPATKNAGWNLSKMKYMNIYLYSLNDDSSLKIRLYTDATNYYTATINHSGRAWRKYQILLSSFSSTGSPAWNNINWLEIETTVPSLLIDSDYVFVPATREQLKLKFTLSRPTASANSPKIKLAKFVWREGN